MFVMVWDGIETEILPRSSTCDDRHPRTRGPNTDGGECLGPLTAGTAYTTKIFTPQLTYRVSTPGWFNYEDTPGNFLPVPPRNDLPGVTAGTSDFLGVYTAILPARVVEPDGCVIQPVPGTWTSPEAVAAWFRGRPNLRASRPIQRPEVPLPSTRLAACGFWQSAN
jgi:hypothetical protein